MKKQLQKKQESKYWHTIDYKQLGKVCPSLIKFSSKIKIPIKEISIGLLTEGMSSYGCPLHIDAPPKNFKINFPIYNTEDMWTEWYDIPESDLLSLPKIVDQHTGKEMYNFKNLHDQVHNLYPCITRYNMHSCPIIFNSYIPHRVMPGSNAKYPRIMLSSIPVFELHNLMHKSN